MLFGHTAHVASQPSAAAVELPVRLHGPDVQVGVSIGTAIATPGRTIEQLVHNADRAM
jgi:GGDEF domain-containing protein